MPVQALLCPAECVNSSNHSGRSRKSSSDSRLPSLCLFCFGFFGSDPHRFPGASPSLCSWTGLVEDKSCNVDVEDELPPELVDNPGTTRGTKLSVFHTNCLLLFGRPVFDL